MRLHFPFVRKKNELNQATPSPLSGFEPKLQTQSPFPPQFKKFDAPGVAVVLSSHLFVAPMITIPYTHCFQQAAFNAN